MKDPLSRNDGLSPWWRHGAILVMIVGFAILSYMTVQTYRHAPPIPRRVVDEAGSAVMTREDIESGQEVFFKYGLMEHGTLWGHGAYLGPDYSAEYLHRLAETVRDAGVQPGTLKQNRYDAATETLVFSPGRSPPTGANARSGAATSAAKNPLRGSRRATSRTRMSSTRLERTSRGRPGPPSPTVPARTTRTPTIGPTSRSSVTRRRREPMYGAPSAS
jgi:hypothetical protein